MSESHRTLDGIIEVCLSGGRPDYDDMRYAICALQSLATMDFCDQLRSIESKSQEFMILRAEEGMSRRKRAYATTPRVWLGPDNDPDSEEVQIRRKLSHRLLEKIQGIQDRKGL